jgi:hypothetical protein
MKKIILGTPQSDFGDDDDNDFKVSDDDDDNDGDLPGSISRSSSINPLLPNPTTSVPTKPHSDNEEIRGRSSPTDSGYNTKNNSIEFT